MYEQQCETKQSTASFKNGLCFQNIGNSNITNNHNSNITCINIVTQTNNINNNNTNTNTILTSIIPQPPVTTRVRNRRYRKLLELRKQGFFDEQAIKLRHPLLYYSFVGQYQYDYYGGEQTVNNSLDDSNKRVTNNNISNSNMNKRGNITINDNSNSKMEHEQQQQYNKQQIGLSTFLSQHLINMQYKQLLDGQMPVQVQQSLTRQNQQNEKQILEMKSLLYQKKNKKNRQDNNQPLYGQYQEQQQLLQQQQEQMQMQMQMQMEEGGQQEQNNINNHCDNNNHILINKANKLSTYTPTQHQINKLKQQHYSYHFNANIDSNSLRSNQYQHSHQQQPDNNNNITHNNKRLLLTLEQRGLQQQHLIEYCEQLFMEGKLNSLNVNYTNNKNNKNNSNLAQQVEYNLTQQMNYVIIDYNQIDNNSQYDDIEQINKDLQQRYFNQSQSQQQQDKQENIDNQNNQYQTGVQDY